jgi:hypothetical protein
MSIGMRNELRPPLDNGVLLASSYGWKDWYLNMVAAAGQIYAANPSLLIFFSGLLFDTTLEPITIGASLGNNLTFNASSFPFANKVVLELHYYQVIPLDCSTIKDTLYVSGFNSLDTSNVTVKNHLPVVMTEFGFAQDDTTYKNVYASCLREYLPAQNAGWMTWVLAGSYYTREGTQDYDESWGECIALYCKYGEAIDPQHALRRFAFTRLVYLEIGAFYRERAQTNDRRVDIST